MVEAAVPAPGQPADRAVAGGHLDRRAGQDAATAEPGVPPFDMTGRPMRGIVVIDSAVLDDKALDRWIGQARAHVAGLPRE